MSCKNKIILIKTNHCPQCKAIKRLIENAIVQYGHPVEIEELDSQSDKAILIAMKHGLDNVPSFVVNDTSFNRISNCVTSDDIIKAFHG